MVATKLFLPRSECDWFQVCSLFKNIFVRGLALIPDRDPQEAKSTGKATVAHYLVKRATTEIIVNLISEEDFTVKYLK